MDDMEGAWYALLGEWVGVSVVLDTQVAWKIVGRCQWWTLDVLGSLGDLGALK